MSDNPTPSEDPDLLDLIEQIGIPKIAALLGINPSAVRQWRKKGVPEGRREALLELATAEGLLSSVKEEPTAAEEEEPPAVDRLSRSQKHRDLTDRTLSRRNQPKAENATTMDGRRKAVRLNRQTVLLVGAGLAGALALGLTQGLRGITGSVDQGRIEQQEPTLIFQPLTAGTIPEFSYTDLTKPETPSVSSKVDKPKNDRNNNAEPRRSQPNPAAARLVQEEAEALRSPLFPSSALALRRQVPTADRQQRQLSGLEGLSLDLPSPKDLFPGRQPSAAEQRESFLERRLDDQAYLRNGLQKPLSTYEVKAGTVIPAALITGLNSDLPGEIVGQVTKHACLRYRHRQSSSDPPRNPDHRALQQQCRLCSGAGASRLGSADHTERRQCPARSHGWYR